MKIAISPKKTESHERVIKHKRGIGQASWQPCSRPFFSVSTALEPTPQSEAELVWRVRACAVKLQVLEAGASPQGRLMQLPRGNSSALIIRNTSNVFDKPCECSLETLQKNRPCQGDAKTPYIDSRFSRTKIKNLYMEFSTQHRS